MKLINSEFVNIDISIDWQSVLTHISDKEGIAITPDPAKWKIEVPAYTEILNIWEAAKFNLSSVKWINYYPETHYPADIDKVLCEALNIKYRRSWISRIDPGYCAPWHWDVEDEPEDAENAVRYSVFLGNAKLGHVFVLGQEDYFVNMQHGQTIKWNNYNQWHLGMNAGLVPKYMYHLKGTIR